MLVPNQTVGTTAAIPFLQVAIHFLLSATGRHLLRFPRPPSRGGHIHVAFAIGINNLDRWKSSLIAPFRCSWSLDFTGVQRTKHGHASVVSKKVRWSLILVAQNSSWSLDRLQKRTLIAWFHFDPGCKRFYRRCVCDYPLLSDVRSGVIEWWLEQYYYKTKYRKFDKRHNKSILKRTLLHTRI